jgi:dTDP-glucose 4,6-dehydratase
MNKKVLITGGAGFIGSYVVRLYVNKYPDYQIFNLDALTYAGNLENIKDIENAGNYHFFKAYITDADRIKSIIQEHKFNSVIHLAEESHGDRSISNSKIFVETNVTSTLYLKEATLGIWKENLEDKLFYHIRTDEVYGTLGDI